MLLPPKLSGVRRRSPGVRLAAQVWTGARGATLRGRGPALRPGRVGESPAAAARGPPSFFFSRIFRPETSPSKNIRVLTLYHHDGMHHASQNPNPLILGLLPFYPRKVNIFLTTYRTRSRFESISSREMRDLRGAGSCLYFFGRGGQAPRAGAPGGQIARGGEGAAEPTPPPAKRARGVRNNK